MDKTELIEHALSAYNDKKHELSLFMEGIARSAILNLKCGIPLFSIAYKNIVKNRKSQSLDL